MTKQKISLLYEVFIAILIVLSVVFTFQKEAIFQLFDAIVYSILVLDLFVRFIKYENKKSFIKKHPLEIIAIIPLDSIFMFARFARLLKIFRLVSLGYRHLQIVHRILKTNGLEKLLVFTTCLLFVVPIIVVYIEPSITTYQDAIWWAVVTTTTVGYGDISPETPIGRIIAAMLMILGIGLIGTITSSISSYFITKNNEEKSHASDILRSIERCENLNEDEATFLIERLKKKIV